MSRILCQGLKSLTGYAILPFSVLNRVNRKKPLKEYEGWRRAVFLCGTNNFLHRISFLVVSMMLV